MVLASKSISNQWRDYELLDSGDGMKRERWGEQILIRPEAAAYWPRKDSAAWNRWDGWFKTSPGKQQGAWEWKNSVPSPWSINYKHLTFQIRPTSSKQVGLFPEQALNWDWCSQKISAAQRPIKLLNLFGYTGAASIAAAAAGASVCHVDASKAMVAWCAENAKLSGLCDEEKKSPIRFIVDDCTKFINRELRRGNRYDAIILDPPSFGRAGTGEIWKLEDQLLSLLKECKNLLSENPLFLMISAYSHAISTEAVEELLAAVFEKKEPAVISGTSLSLRGSLDGTIVPCGVTARWEAAV